MNWFFIFGTTFLICNLIVGVADLLQGGIVWPVPLLMSVMQGVVLTTRR